MNSSVNKNQSSIKVSKNKTVAPNSLSVPSSVNLDKVPKKKSIKVNNIDEKQADIERIGTETHRSKKENDTHRKVITQESNIFTLEFKDEIDLSTKEKAEIYKKMKRPDFSPTK